MADLTSANYVFLPWVRQGVASGIQTPDRSPNQAGVASVAVKLRVNNTDDNDIDRQVRLYGPGDVTGIDPQQVVRTEPRHLAMDFEPNYFPAIEFDRPDFPWLFTPAKADAAGTLRPWLCLVVVRKQEGVTLHVDRNLPLPVLEIARPERELPDLSESWAWAHAQVARTGSPPDPVSLTRSLAGDPALTVSRLLCPRRLDPVTEYLACLVPAFELGRKAGLGSSITPDDEKELKPAWAAGAEQVTLPVYFHWEFRTGTGGDFEELVGLLKARPMPSEVGKRLMDISQPGFNTPSLPAGTTLELEGALRLLRAPTAEWPEETRTPFQTELKKILDAPSQTVQEDKEPLLAPPIYGRWQAARHTVEITPAPPASVTWLDELNLDPRHRAVAALGTQAVQTQQEQLMASAWEQLGEIERINQMRRQAQLGRAVNGVYHARHFTQFSEETLPKVLAPAQSRVVVAGTVNEPPTTMLLSRKISQSAIPARAISAPLRRLTSPRGVISTRFRTVGAPPIAIVAMLNTTTIVQAEKKEAGLVTIDQVSDQVVGATMHTVGFIKKFIALDTAPQLGKFQISAEGDVPMLLRALLATDGLMPVGLSDSPDAQAFRDAAKKHQAYVDDALPLSFSFFVNPMNLAETKFELLRSLEPEKTISARVNWSLTIAGAAEPSGDPLEPLLDAPEFPQPMYEAVRDLSQDFLLPGLEHVPPNTVTLLETNPKFVESLLVGLNAEMSRELLWRNYPTDQRGTYFRQFWDTSVGTAQPDDIQPINTWGDSKLGDNAHADEQLVLLVRGELLRRYPNSVIYAVKAERKDGQLNLLSGPEHESHPIFRGTLNPDVTFLGFNLTEPQASAEPGWFFVIQQQPTEPRFGLDVADFEKLPQPPSLTTWSALSWRHLVNTEEELKALSHASINPVPPDIEKLSDIDKAKWGRNSAHQAYITLQRPVRIAIHASEMLSQGSM